MGDAWQKSGLAKASSVAAYALDLLQNAGTKILVFAHHKSVMDALEQNLVRGLKGAKAMMRIDGTTPPRERQRLVEAFQNNPSTRLALLSVTAAGTGLTLTAASAVLFAELHWTPGVLVQAEDRAHRIGQHASVNVHYLVLKDESQSVDMALWRAIGNKVKVVGKTIDGMEKASLGATAATAPRSEQDALVSFFDQEGARAQQVAKADIRSFFAPKKKKAPPPDLDDAALIRATEAAERAAAAPKPKRYDPRTLLAAPAPAPPKKRRSSEGSGSAADPLDLCLSSDDEKEDQRWPCAACTFSNDSKRTTCEICATPRTATAPRRSSASSTASRRSTGSSAAVPRRSSASSTTSTTTRYAFSVSANTGRVSAFSGKEGAPFARLMDAFDPSVLVDGEGRLLPLSADDLGLDDDEDARAVKKFVAAWRSLRAVDRQTLSGDELLEEALDVELRKRRASSSDKCFDRGVARPRKRARSTEDDEDDKRACPWCEKPLPAEAPDGSFCDWACASEHKLRKPNNSQASRSQLFALEHGVCTACGLDAHALYRRVKALTPPERFQVLMSTPGFAPRGKKDRRLDTCLECDYWQADHIIPVAEGGGCCSLDNFRTLCTPCHQKETNALRQRLAARKNAAAAAGTRDLRSFFSVSSGK